MRIEQQNGILDLLQQNSGIEEKGSAVAFKEKVSVAKSKYSDKQSISMKDSTYLNPALAERDTLAEEMERGTGLDATSRKNQMAVLSHTTSEEDYEKMCEEGFSLESTGSNTIVTVIDKIKAQIAKAGGDISCFSDGLSDAEIEALTGNAALASQLEAALREADLPSSEENVKDCMEAYYLADSLEPLTEGAMKYMLDNELPPTIENLYKAAYSGSANYVTPTTDTEFFGIKKQMESIIRNAGLSVSEQTLSDSKWLLNNEIPLTAKNLAYLEDLKAYTGNLSGESLVDSIVTALAEGHLPKDAMMISGYSMLERAQDAVSVVENATDADLQYLIDKGFELTVENLKMASTQDKTEAFVPNDDLRFLTARRQLEETRLIMTVEANYSLLKRGISIDIKPLVELVEELRNEENQYYARLLESQDVPVSEETVTTFAETTEKLQAIQTVPAYVLGLPKAEISDISGVYDRGMALKAALEKANQSYETLMTAPRSDLGDSYSKAFQNVDAILSDVGMDATDENRRAVRILAYNQLEISEQSVLEMKAADEEVQRVFKNMSPRVIIEMLRKGVNPLEMDFEQINKMAEQIKKETDGNDAERFSEFLWKLERNHNISAEERSSFIGIYRLIHQVEQTDGAAIGALVNQGADITLKNLLTAVRSGKKKMDVSVDEAYGEKEHASGYQNSILDQIMTGYQSNCLKDAKEALTPDKLSQLSKDKTDWMEMTPEQLAKALAEMEDADTSLQEEYVRMQLDGFKHCAETPEEVYRLLEQYDVPNSVQNILAMETMLSDRNRLFRKLLSQEELNADKTSEFEWQKELDAIKQQLIEDFGNAVSEPKELARVQEDLGKLAENAMKTMIESEEVTSIDIREARMMQAQIAIQKQMAKKETYSVPVLVGDEVTNVTLKIVRGVEKRGVVDIMLESKLAGKIAATFQAKEHGISGVIATDNRDTKAHMTDCLTDIVKALQEEDADVKVAYISELDLTQFTNTSVTKGHMDSAIEGIDRINREKASETEPADSADYEVQTSRLYRIAESFIRVMRENYK